jgi:hypothetical protein
MTVAHPGFVFDMMNLGFDGRLDSNEYNCYFDLDADHDSTVSKEEFGNVSSAALIVFAKDGDGFLTRDEWEAGLSEFATGFDLFDTISFARPQCFAAHLRLQ